MPLSKERMLLKLQHHWDRRFLTALNFIHKKEVKNFRSLILTFNSSNRFSFFFCGWKPQDPIAAL
jgi:hypothetical protein